MNIDVIILSKCKNASDFEVNLKCIYSLIKSEANIAFDIKIIESDTQFPLSGFNYPFSNVTVIVPNLDFNYNKFLNIGLGKCKNDWVVFCNNDILFHSDWLSNILSVKLKASRIQSFSPFDPDSIYLKRSYFMKEYYVGYRVPIELVGWCLVMQKTIFAKTGPLDENFDMYFQDNDWALTLKKNNIRHALVTASHVTHIGGYTTGAIDASTTEKYKEDKHKFLQKWGSTFSLRIKDKLYSVFSKVGLETVGRLLY